LASSGRTALLGTHHGGIGAQHVEAYLNEFVFRFNRRRSSARAALLPPAPEWGRDAKARLRHDRLVASRAGREAAWAAAEAADEARPEGRAAMMAKSVSRP
jgi:hypothetical protein